jgi:hypothetical protein
LLAPAKFAHVPTRAITLVATDDVLRAAAASESTDRLGKIRYFCHKARVQDYDSYVARADKSGGLRQVGTKIACSS